MKRKLLLAIALIFCFKSFSQENASSEILLFPNTASTQVNLVLPSDTSPTNIAVYDLSGRLVKNVPLINSSVYTIDTREMTQGMYIVAVTTPVETRIKKFVVDPNSINNFSNYAHNGNGEFNVVSLTANTNSVTHLEPIEDAYLQGSSRYNTVFLQVNGTSRISYLKYDLRSLNGNISNASLKFTTASDPGSGTISIYKGNGTNWTEDNLSTSNKPSQGTLLGSINKTYSIGNEHTISFNSTDLGSSYLSLIVVHSNGDDTNFASKEHTSIDPPTLSITHNGSSNTGSSTGTKSLEPLDDAYLEGSTRYNTTISKVYTTWRSSYFKFDLNSVPGNITSAKLQFTVDSDAGSGTIQVYKGNSTNWTEENLSTSNRPSKGSSPIGTTSGTHSIGKRVSIDLDVNSLSSSLQSLVMVQPTGMNDFAFVTKEHTTKEAPKLVLTYEDSDGGSDTTDDNNNDSGGSDSSDNNGSNSQSLAPLDDAYLEGSTRHNTSIVKVYTTWRSGYLKFDLRSIPGNITGASLKFTIDSDPGNGLIQVYKGNSTNWTEDNLSTSNRPAKSSSPIGTTTGTHSLGKRVSIDLDVNSLSNSLLSLVMTQAADTDDIAFVSKEHATKAAPELVITYEGSGDSTDTTDDNTDTTDDNTTDDTTDNNDGTNSILNPLDDAYLEGSTRHNTTISKVYTTWRSSYFKFDLRSLPSDMTSATLQFTIDSDAGNGLLQVYKGNSTNWTEESLSTSNRPAKGSSPLGSVNSTYGLGQRISIALDISNLSNELLSLVMVQAPDTDDIAFATKEHGTIKGPQLVITYGDEPDGTTGKPPTCTETNYSFLECGIDFDIIHNIGAQDLLNAQFQSELLANLLDEAWARKERPKLTDEINRQLNTDYSSYDEAKNAYTENYVKNIRKVESLANNIKSDFSSDAWKADQKQLTYTAELSDLRNWDKLSTWCDSHQTPECTRLSNTNIRGVNLGNLTGSGFGNTRSPELDRLLTEVEKDFSDVELEAGLNRSYRDGMGNLINDGNLVNTFAGLHNRHIDNQSIVGEIELMVQYLWYTERARNGFSLSNNPKNPFPIFSNTTTLENMGEENAPLLGDEIRIFRDYFFLNEAERCNYLNSSVARANCRSNYTRLVNLKEEVIQEHIDELPPYTITIDIAASGGIVNPTKELRCFDIMKGAKLTVYVEQPVANSREITAALGHTFIGIEQDGIRTYLGFYPINDTAAFIDVKSEIHSNSESPYDVSISKEISPRQLVTIISYIKNYQKIYNLNDYNCSHFGIEVGNLGGLNLPSTIGEEDFIIVQFKGANPADLGEDIREMQEKDGIVIDREGGKAPKKTKC